MAGADGASAFAAGTTAAPAIQGSNDGSTWVAVTADKGTLPANFTAVGLTALHFQNLLYKQYRFQVVSTGAPIMNITAVWGFVGLADSYDSTVQ